MRHGQISQPIKKQFIMRVLMFFALATLFMLVCPSYFAGAQEERALLLINQAQTTGIDGREWDKSFSDAMTVDAVHRAVLLRFPFSAEKIKARLEVGLT